MRRKMPKVGACWTSIAFSNWTLTGEMKRTYCNISGIWYNKVNNKIYRIGCSISMKRETGVNPVRSRRRKVWIVFYMPLGNWEGENDRSYWAGRPAYMKEQKEASRGYGVLFKWFILGCHSCLNNSTLSHEERVFYFSSPKRTHYKKEEFLWRKKLAWLLVSSWSPYFLSLIHI